MKATRYGHLLLLIFFIVSFGFAQEPLKLSSYPKEQVHLFLLAGQSNMAGRGKVEAIDKEIHPRLFALTKEGIWSPAVDPIHYDKRSAGVGLGKSFALHLLEQNADMVIGLVPSACGGSPISTWVPGGYHGQTNSHPYDDAIKRMQSARKDGILKGILWHQGESDSNEKSNSSQYAERLKILIQRFRKDLGVEDIPFIIGQLGKFENKPWSAGRREVDQAHASMSTMLPNVAFVLSDGLTAKADRTHFNSESLRIFGSRYAEAYLRIVKQDALLNGNKPRE